VVEEFGALRGEWDGEAVAAEAGAAAAAAAPVGEVARAVPAGACLVRGCLTSLVILLLLLDGSSGGLRVFRRGKVLQSPNTATFAQFLDGSLGFAYLQFLCYARCCFRSTARALGVCQGLRDSVSLCAVYCMFLQFSC